MIQKQAALEWIRDVFVDDILKQANDGFDKGYLCIMPSMEAQSFLLVYNYYTGDCVINNSSEGTGSRVYMELSKFADHFAKVIEIEKNHLDNINNMIEETIKEKKGDLLVAYFCLCQDRIKYANFVDIRRIFHSLYKAYVDSYNAETGIDNRTECLYNIKQAHEKFEKFLEQEDAKKAIADAKGIEYVKEFFNG